jgi:acyl carrier protein
MASYTSRFAARQQIIREIQEYLVETLSLEVESTETDLLEAGILDSIAQVNLLVHLEHHFGCALPMDSLEIDSFRSVEKIAELVGSHSGIANDVHGKEAFNAIVGVSTVTAAENNGHSELIRAIRELVEQTCSMQVEAEANLFEIGALDSMTLVQLISSLEDKFRFQLPVEEIEMESFHSITKIAELVASQTKFETKAKP